MNALTVAEIHIGGEGVRTLHPQNIEFHLKEGTLLINGKSGEGKTTLLEIIKLATQGSKAKRDTNLLKAGESETEIRVKIADVKQVSGIAFYIRCRVKATGEVINTFQIDADGELKNTENPIAELGKLTVAKLQNIMSTSLTWGIDEFLSENYIEVRNFIFESFSEELGGLGLLLKRGDVGYAESIIGRIETAIAERDEFQREQSKLGAYIVNLKDFERPEQIDLSLLEAERAKLTEEIAVEKANEKNAEIVLQGKIDLLKAKKQTIYVMGQGIKKDIAEWNEKQKEQSKAKDQLFADKIEQAERFRRQWLEIDRFFELTEERRVAVLAIEKQMDYVQEALQKEKEDVQTYLHIEESSTKELGEAYPQEAIELFNRLQATRKEYLEINAAIEAAESPGLEKLDASNIKERLIKQVSEIDVQIAFAKESNELLHKFEVLDKYQEADKKVKDLYIERNKMYTQVNCGVKGLAIGVTNDETGQIGFYYDGFADPEYFGNERKELRPLTSYSKSQKIYIAAQLQCSLMKKKQYPLNVLCVDDTGVDKRVHQLWSAFAKKYGLLILVTSTNDKTKEDIGANEILIEKGEVFSSII